MIPGWFDAFRTNGGPTLYSESNRTPVIEDVRNVFIYVSFSTLFIAFLIIFPGIRKERFTSLLCVTTSLLVGAAILLANFGSDWHVASSRISGSYRAFSRERLHADISVRIGLTSVNITLQALPIHRRNVDIKYNERFSWVEASQMKKEYREALVKGLPFPILTIAEYFSHNLEGFSWGGKYRKAGYYTSIILWSAFALWLLSNILLCAVPRYGSYSMALLGAVLLCAGGLYVCMLPQHPPLVIHMETNMLTFKLGWSFWAIIGAGVLALVVGGALSLVDALFPRRISTIFEVDYDTPYRYFVGQDVVVGPTTSKSLHPPLSSQAESCAESATEHAENLESQSKLSKDVVPSGESSVEGFVNESFEGDDDEPDNILRRYGTIVNGKRAVSLRHFGKFAQKEAGKRKHMPNLQRKINSFSSERSFQRSNDVNIDLQGAASMW